MWGSPSFFTTRTELFVLCMVRAGVYPVLALYVYVGAVSSIFGHDSPAFIENLALSIMFPLAEEHSRYVVARASTSPLRSAVWYSLIFGTVETVLFIPMWSGEGSPLDPWLFFLLIRTICIFAHVLFGAMVGIGARIGTTMGVIGGVALATAAHFLFNMFGISLVLSRWLVG